MQARTRDHLPRFWELAQTRVEAAGRKDKVINLKITILTAKMMIEKEKGEITTFSELRAKNRERVLEAIVNGVMQDERYAEAVAKAYANTLTIDEIIEMVHTPA